MKRKNRKRTAEEVNAYLAKITEPIIAKFQREKERQARAAERARLKPWKKMGINSGAFRAQQACNALKRRMAFGSK